MPRRTWTRNPILLRNVYRERDITVGALAVHKQREKERMNGRKGKKEEKKLSKLVENCIV